MQYVLNIVIVKARQTAAGVLNSRGVDLLKLFLRSGFTPFWQIGVWMIRRALSAAHDDGERRMYLGNLSEALRIRYEHDRDPAYLNGAIEAGRRAVLGVTAGAVAEAQRMAGLGVALRLRFEHAEDVSGGPVDAGDLDEAEKWCRLALDLVTDDEDPFRALGERALADTLLARYEHHPELQVLDEAIRVYRAAARPRLRRSGDPGADPQRGAAADTDADDSAAAEALSSLSAALRLRYDRFGGEEVLAEAIRCGERAVQATDDPAERALCLEDLAQCFDSRYENTRALSDAAEAVRVHRSAVELIPAQHRERFALEANLGRALRAYGSHADDTGAVLEAIALRRRALAASAGRGRRHGVIESELGMDLVAYYELTNDESTLDEALGCARRAATLVRGTPNEPAADTNLGHILRTLYELRSDERHFEEALRVCRAAVDLTDDDDESRPEYLSNLSNILVSGFETTGDRARLAEAIDLARSAAYDDGPARTPDPGLYSNLGNLLAILHENTGDLDTLREAVAAGRRAVALNADHPADRPGSLANLGRAILVLYERTSERPVLNECVDLCREAVVTSSADDPDRPLFLHGLGNALYTRFEIEPTDHDIRDALTAYREAADLCSPDHRDRPMHLASLGMGLLGLGQHTGDSAPVAVDESIAILRSAVEMAPESDPQRAKYLNNLGLALQARATAQDVAEAGRVFRQAAESITAATTVRIHASREWGLAAGAAGSWQEATEAFELCAELLTRVTSPSLDRLDQEHQLTLFPDLSTEAAVSALEAEAPDKALMLLERTRGVLLAQALRMRPDAAALELASPDRARRLEELRAALDSDAGAPEPDSRRHASRAAMVEELESIAEEIRSLPGLDRFLRPPTLDELLEQAASGPVIFLNTHRLRSDALIVDANGLRVKRLPLLTPDSAAQMQAQFTNALLTIRDEETSAEERERAEATVTQVLGQLWDTVAEPILSELGFTTPQPPTSSSPPAQARLPRIWWASTGPLAALPLHIAGYHGYDDEAGPIGRSVLDRAISSYTPTIEALRHTRERSAPIRPRRVLAVGMPHTPGESDLPGVAREVKEVQSRFANASTTLLDDEATWQRVHDLLPEHSWAHFACHGVGDMAEPSASRLLLADHLERPFTVQDLSRLRLEQAELAILSACETTRPATRLPAEAIHVTGAFQLAGFRQVIGTLWPVNDRIARRFTHQLYTHLLHDETDPPQGAHAVHAVTVALREHYRPHPSLWSPFIHAGW